MEQAFPARAEHYRQQTNVCVEKFMKVLLNDILPVLPVCAARGNVTLQSELSVLIGELLRSLHLTVTYYKRQVPPLLHHVTDMLRCSINAGQPVPRPPYTLLLEMVQLLHGKDEHVMLLTLQQYRMKLKPTNRQSNMLEARTLCKATLKNRGVSFWGGNAIGYCNFALRRMFIDGLVAHWFHPAVAEVVRTKGNTVVGLQRPGSIASTAYQIDDIGRHREGENHRKHDLDGIFVKSPCLVCKRTYPTVSFVPTDPDEDKTYPYGNCAENYAISRLLRSTNLLAFTRIMINPVT